MGVRVGCRDRPETDMTGPLTRARLHAGSDAAVQHKQDFCSLLGARSETRSWQLRSLSQSALRATQLSRWLLDNANHCCMAGPPEHGKSNAALTVCLRRKGPCFSETSNSPDSGVACAGSVHYVSRAWHAHISEPHPKADAS